MGFRTIILPGQPDIIRQAVGRQTHLPPFGCGFARGPKPTQLIDWSGLDEGYPGACGRPFLETTAAPPASAIPPALRSAPLGSFRLVPIDKAGRIVLPKVVRHELAIKPGDVLRVAIQGLVVTLTPSKETTGLVRHGKALVFSTTSDELLSSGAVADLQEGERGEHDLSLAKT